jgi:hypothetical protein
LLPLGLLVLFLSSCGGGAGSNASDADRAAISDEIAASEFFSNELNSTDEDAAALSRSLASEEEGPLALAEGSASVPLFWWRGEWKHQGRDLDIQIVGDTASVSVVDHVQGNLRVKWPGLSLWTKPFEESLTRYAEFTRLPLEDRPPRWVLTKLSPVEAALENPSEQTVQIEWIRASKCTALSEDGITCSEWTTVWESLSPASLFAVPDELPTFYPEDFIRVEAQVSNTEESYTPSEFVFLHRPGLRPGNFFGRVRDRMVDDGTHGDQTAGDGIYSRTYPIVFPGRHFAAVDVMNAASFMEEDAPYNSAGWGMPYRVVEP